MKRPERSVGSHAASIPPDVRQPMFDQFLISTFSSLQTAAYSPNTEKLSGGSGGAKAHFFQCVEGL